MAGSDIEAFRRFVEARREDYIAELARLSSIECGTEMVEGVNEVAAILADRLDGLGLRVQRHPAEGFGDHLVATTGVPGGQIVLGGHIDTTYTDYADLPSFHVDGDYAVGPGASDMKGGIVIYLGALDCLQDAGRLAELPVTVMLNSDEERGAPTGRELFRRQIPHTRTALFSEVGGPGGEFLIARRGKISYRIDVAGANMHAGDGAAPKRSALLALSHIIIELEALNREFDGVAVNLGRAWGGVASNTVAGRAVGLLDIRYPDEELEGELRRRVEAICSAERVAGVTAKPVETSYRPVWNRPADSRPLIGLLESVAGGKVDVLDRPLTGTADSNWFGAAGVPTLDGLGARGFDEHTRDERLLLPSLFDRIPLVAGLIEAIAAT